MDEDCKAAQQREKQEKKKRIQSSTKLGDREEFTLWCRWRRIFKNSQKSKKKTGKTHGTNHAMQKDGSSWYHESDTKQWQWKGVQNNAWLKSGISWIHKASSGTFTRRPHCRQRIYFQWHITIWCTSLFRCHKRWRFPIPCTRNGHSSRQSQHTWRWFSNICKRSWGITTGHSTFAIEAMKTNVLFTSSSVKAAIHLGPNKTENLEVHKKTDVEENSELVQFHAENDIVAFWRDSECT